MSSRVEDCSAYILHGGGDGDGADAGQTDGRNTSSPEQSLIAPSLICYESLDGVHACYLHAEQPSTFEEWRRDGAAIYAKYMQMEMEFCSTDEGNQFTSKNTARVFLDMVILKIGTPNCNGKGTNQKADHRWVVLIDCMERVLELSQSV